MNRQRNEKFILLGLLALLTVTPSHALNDGDLQRAILESKALGNIGASVQVRGPQAYVSTYLEEGETINTAKAKAVLVAKCLLDKVPSLAAVHCTFCSPQDTRRLIAVDVPEALIKSFASGRTSMPKLLASLSAQDKRNAADTVSSLDLVMTGEVHIDDRKRQVSMINALRNDGSDVKEISKEFNLEQVAIDANDEKGYHDHFNACSSLIEAFGAAANARARNSSNNSKSPVKPGLFVGPRAALWAALAQLRHQPGFAQSGLQERFDAIERAVGTDKEPLLRDMITNLNSKINTFRQTKH